MRRVSLGWEEVGEAFCALYIYILLGAIIPVYSLNEYNEYRIRELIKEEKRAFISTGSEKWAD